MAIFKRKKIKNQFSLKKDEKPEELKSEKKRQVIFFDVETDAKGERLLDIGAVSEREDEFHALNEEGFAQFLKKGVYLCGHNIFEHDLKYVSAAIEKAGIEKFIDTLLFSPLLFPTKPYHRLGKMYKLISEEEPNNPFFDAKLDRDLFYDEVNAFNKLDERLKSIFYLLLSKEKQYRDFFDYLNFQSTEDCLEKIQEYFFGKICENANISKYIVDNPIELAYSLALINSEEKYSLTPHWVSKKYPSVENIMYYLRSHRCSEGCDYCNNHIEPNLALKKFFGYDSFRLFDGEPLQEMATTAAIDGKSLLAVFPTGGGKSITFQLPALIQGEAVKGLTVVISPLQSLMKDQVENLEIKGLTDAVTINGSMDPIEREKAYYQVEEGLASILYISPESLRSKTMENLLLKRNVVRFVIDEAHCFSSWGQDFRVDYLYIGDFIKKYQETKNLPEPIPVSCFTATAKLKVVLDIKEYFKEKLSLDLEVLKSGSQRKNLDYHVYFKTSDSEKYAELRNLLEERDCPAIVYVSRTKKAEEISQKLNSDGISGGSVFYHGKMDRQERIDNQEKFMNGDVRIIVATTAFGMGVDKSNVGLVVHYDISTSLEDYVQEAGRAGRDEKINAECFILYDEEDLNKHFVLLNQGKLSIKEIQQVWKAIKELTKIKASVSRSALEIAREAGWDDSILDIETRVRTAIAALEEAGFMKRGQNSPKIYANSILVKNMKEAAERIDASVAFTDEKEKENAKRIMTSLLSAKSRVKIGNGDAESRIDYLSDRLGIKKEDVLRVINTLRGEKILADIKDLLAFIKRTGKINTSLNILYDFDKLEKEIINNFSDEEIRFNIKEFNKKCEEIVPSINVQKIKTIFNFYTVKQWIKKGQTDNKDILALKFIIKKEELSEKHKKLFDLAGYIIKMLFEKSIFLREKTEKEEAEVEFSCLEIKEGYEKNDLLGNKTTYSEIDDALYYLLKIGALRLEGAFLVGYNAMNIERNELAGRRLFKKEDYQKLEEYYNNKIQQIHIVGEYAKRMTVDYKEALQFVDDYFKLEYDYFLKKYFRGRETEIKNNITPKKFKQLFGDLSPRQLSIIKDSSSKYIVVAAGPGSGKTKVLVHKLASLYMMEDVKHEQMLMLTFSRSAAIEFRRRLSSPSMLGASAYNVQISTFHSYCYDLLGRIGSLEDTSTIIKEAVEKIKTGEIETSKITKTVLVIDEAQDMSEAEFSLVEALMEANEEMRIIAVGDDDQNIYEFRNSDSKYLRKLITDYEASKYELLDNYRSKRNIVALSNLFVEEISDRLKKTGIVAVSKDNGNVSITKYSTENLSVPLIADVLNRKYSGTTCVLTETNDDAATIAGLLVKNGIQARLIQDNSGFSINNLEEIRFFIDTLQLKDDAYKIDEDDWERAKNISLGKYFGLPTYEYLFNFIKIFEESNTKFKYKRELFDYIFESKLEDFYTEKSAKIVVSTIHKAKGREFDNVFLMIKQNPTTDDKKRAIYVAMTRAKTNLHIHCNINCFDGKRIEGVEKILNTNSYQEPEEIVVPISHSGVYLSGFYFYKKDIEKLKSGDELVIQKEIVDYKNGNSAEKYFGYSTEGKKVIQFSDSTSKQIEDYEKKGYIAQSGRIRFIVWWRKNSDDLKESLENKIILPDIIFEINDVKEL